MDGIISIGDTPGDHPTFSVSGLAVAVANANNFTRQFVISSGGCIMNSESIDGVCDLLECVLHTRDMNEIASRLRSQKET